jgi:hypothetical protein
MKAFNEQGRILLKCLNIVFFEFFYNQHPPPLKFKKKKKHQKGKNQSKRKRSKVKNSDHRGQGARVVQS